MNAITTTPDNIPTELRSEHRWVVADIEDRHGKTTKVPYRPFDPARRADTTDPSTWSDFETARELVERGRFPMLGFVLGNGFVGVDLDKCRNPETGVIESWATDIIELLDCYTETSVSGTGIHVISYGKLPLGGNKKGKVEMYGDKRYFVTTGHMIRSAPIEDRTAELAILHANTFGRPAVNDRPATPSSGTDLTDDAVLERARSASNGGKFQRLWSGDITMHNGDDSAADLALCRLLAFFTRDAGQIDRLVRRSGLYRPKWNRQDYRDRTIATSLAGTRCSSSLLDGHAVDIDPATIPTGKKPKTAPSHATTLVTLMQQDGADFFHMPDGQLYVTLPMHGHRETLKLKSEAWLNHLADASFRATGRAPTSAAIKDAVGVMSALARAGAEHPVFVRLARTDDAIWLDLGRPDQNAVKVTANGWELVDTPDVRFRRPKGVLALPVPTHGSDGLTALLSTLINVRDERDMQLVLGWLVGALRGKGPYPILSVTGEQGSAKSTACRILRRLIDPNVADLRSTPKEPRDLMITAKNGHILAFDNLSYIPDWLSDELCCLATGAGFSTRQLFSDDDEVLFAAARPVLVNGITDIVTRADLLSRALIVTLEPIADSARRSEADLDAMFKAQHPAMLGALLDAVAMALKHEATTTLAYSPRMVDFATWVQAAEPALGQPTGTFLAAYRDNQQTALESSLEGDSVVDAIRKLPRPWSGQLQDLLREIPEGDQKPKTPKALSKLLTRLAPALRATGIDVVSLPRVRGQRRIEVRRTSSGRPSSSGRMLTLPMRGNTAPDQVGGEKDTRVGDVQADSAYTEWSRSVA